MRRVCFQRQNFSSAGKLASIFSTSHQMQARAQRIGAPLGKAVGQMLAIVLKALWQKHFNRFFAQLPSPVAKQLLARLLTRVIRPSSSQTAIPLLRSQ